MSNSLCNKSKYQITVVGMGYVGLSVAVMLAQRHEITAVDILLEKVEKINNRISPVKDDELQYYFQNVPLSLTAVQTGKNTYKNADYIFIAVPTNYDQLSNSFDTSIIESVVEDALEERTGACIVIKSTVPIGYTEALRKKYKYSRILFCPEFIRESKALYDNLYPSRIVVGVDMQDSSLVYKADILGEILKKGAIKENIQVLFVSYAEAEAIKLFSNTYLAMRISFFNELDTYAEQKGLNTKSIIEGVCLDPRIGQYYNNPSFGYGGYCLPKDTKQLLADYGAIPQSITQATIESNKLRKNYIINQIKQVLNDKYFSKAGMRNCKDIVIGIYRLTMKCNSDNYRQSAIWEIIEALEKENYSIIVYEPMCDEQLAYKLAITKNIISFKKRCNIILANRYDDELYDVLEKVYTRDIFGRD